jgi:hypothetical protein
MVPALQAEQSSTLEEPTLFKYVPVGQFKQAIDPAED